MWKGGENGLVMKRLLHPMKRGASKQTWNKKKKEGWEWSGEYQAIECSLNGSRLFLFFFSYFFQLLPVNRLLRSWRTLEFEKEQCKGWCWARNKVASFTGLSSSFDYNILFIKSQLSECSGETEVDICNKNHYWFKLINQQRKLHMWQKTTRYCQTLWTLKLLCSCWEFHC